MAKHLAIFNGAATDEARAAITPEESDAFIERWREWASPLGPALVDPGAPLHRKIRLSADAVEPLEDPRTAYAVVDAVSHDCLVPERGGSGRATTAARRFTHPFCTPRSRCNGCAGVRTGAPTAAQPL